MEVPSPFSGKVKNILLKVGDKVSQGTVILVLDPTNNSKDQNPESVEEPKTLDSETDTNQTRNPRYNFCRKKAVPDESVSTKSIKN